MDRELLDEWRRILNVWNSRDWDAWIELWTPDCEWDSAIRRALEGSAGSIYRGHDGWREFIGDFLETWDRTRVEIDQARRIGHVVFLVGRVIGTGRHGAESGQSIAYAYERVADGRIKRGYADFDVSRAERVAQDWARSGA